MKIHLTILLYILISSTTLFAQNKIDSLMKVLNKDQKNQAKTMILLSKEWFTVDMDSSLFYALKSKEISEISNNVSDKAGSFTQLGKIYRIKNLNGPALQNFTKAFENYVILRDKVNLAEIRNFIGLTYEQQGNYTKALESYQESLTRYNQNKDLKGASKALNNIGGIFYNLGDLEKSLNYYLKSLEINEKLHYLQGIAASHNNIGNLYNSVGNLQKALAYYNRSLAIKKDLNDTKGIASAYNNIGSVYYSQKNYTKAFEFYQKSIDLEIKIGNDVGVSESLENMGSIYLNKLSNIPKAKEYFERSFAIAQRINHLPQIRNCNQKFALLYERSGNIELSYQYFKKYILARDSLLNLEKIKTIAELENKNELEQSITNYRILSQEKELTDASLKRQLIFIYSLSIVGVLLVLLVLLAYNRYLVKQEANKLLIVQNIEIQRQQLEILASINYAKNIQNAILPSENVLGDFFDEFFILYIPKDIVSGDFYWMHTEGNQLIVAAADCTGHGVPGGFLSMLGTALLNDIVHNNQNASSSEILNLLNLSIIQLLHQDREGIKTQDGMDIALCKYNTQSHLLEYSGAHNPLYFVRNSKLEVFRADRLPIGIFAIKDKQFTNQTIETQKGDQAYIFSDGFIDQFGGKQGHKFKSRQFKTMLENISSLSMIHQKKYLEEMFKNWKGDLEQVDDILIIGMKF